MPHRASADERESVTGDGDVYRGSMHRAFLVVTVALLACSSRDRGTQGSSSAESRPTALQIVAQIRASHRELARLGLAKSARPLPSSADGAMRIGDDPWRSVWVRPLDVRPVGASTVDGAHVFADVSPATDLALADDGERFEEARVLRDGRASRTARWELATGEGITLVRARGATIEALDAHGKVAVRTGRIFYVDARHVERDAELTVTKTRDAWIVTAILETAGLEYPIVLDPVWLPGPSMAVARSSPAIARAPDGKVYLACGDIQFNTFEAFDPATDSFVARAPMPDLAFECFATFGSDGKLRVLGEGKVRVYDAAANSWAAGATTTPVTSATWVVLADGKILRAGGMDGSIESSTAEVYDPVANTWTPRGNLLTPRRGALGTAIPGNKAIVIGGTSGSALSTTEIYDVAAGTWSAGASMSTPRERFGLGVSGTKALVVGGRAGTTELSTSELYDLAANTFAAGPSLAVGRPDLTVVAGPEGAVVLGGSQFTEGSHALADLTVAPFTTFTKLPNMIFARQKPAAVRLLDGRIFVASSAGFGNSNTTELLSALPNGATCAWKGECVSGFCVSGVCCDAACTGECQRCNNTASVGSCGTAPAATPCGTGAACSGSTLTPRGTCPGGTATTCTASTAIACAGGLTCADATSCRSKCTLDAECTTARCDVATGLCLPALVDSGPADTGTVPTDTGTLPLDTGMPDTFVEDLGVPPVAPVPEGSPKVVGSAQLCKTPADCTTGFCVDGVCCDSPCTERCHSCVLPGTPGRCTESPIGVDLRAECGPALSCAGTCGKGGVCTASVQGSQCAASTCTGPSTGKGAGYCKANGVPCAVEESVPFDCGAYACDSAFGACRTSCNNSDACAPGFICDTPTKTCARLAAEEDTGCATTQTGRSTASGPASALGLLVALAALGRARRR